MSHNRFPIPGAGLLKVAHFLEVPEFLQFQVSADIAELRQLVHGSLSGACMEFWITHLTHTLAETAARAGREVEGEPRLTLALEPTWSPTAGRWENQPQHVLEAVLGKGASSDLRRHDSVLYAEGASVVRALAHVFGSPLNAYALLRPHHGLLRPCFVAFAPEHKIVAWGLPEGDKRFAFGAFKFDSDGASVFLRLGISLDVASGASSGDTCWQGYEGFRDLWHARECAQQLRVIGTSFLPGNACRCGKPVCTASELQRLLDNLPVCPGCRALEMAWAHQEMAEEQRRLQQKADAKAKQEKKPRARHGSSAKPYSQKRR
eukprot:CAMPEP_0179268926 /NCGR_PEP_ID=MMETSP0797-20121207/30694_1 /TAXON_ID=47934 /ORGANISM="Dinophysis acuminata, Strain DAEP01" /LENGTH=318 /DNA_ID=CAMNT_0020977227 /DNA_START=23 /DNA_END=979 /DNA_ORIENTATION=+